MISEHVEPLVGSNLTEAQACWLWIALLCVLAIVLLYTIVEDLP